jgi:hypothetical protein
MRTNALLLSAALVAGGTALAQGTVSKNIVGYVNKTVPASGLVMIANPLNNGGNTVEEVIKTDGDLILYHYGTAGFSSSESLTGLWLSGGDIVVAPGGGFFAGATGGSEVAITFVGEVAVGATVSIPAGLSIRSSVLPQAGNLDALEYPVGDEVIYKFVNNSYESAESIAGTWLGDAPSFGVGDAFWVLNSGDAKTWSRTFTIE